MPNEPTHFSRGAGPRLLLLAVAAAYWLVLFGATHMPLAAGSGVPSVPHQDKVAHALAFATLGFLATAAARSLFAPRPIVYAGILPLLAAYAALDEWSQQWVAHRSPDLLDWIADIAGAAMGMAAVFVVWPLLQSIGRRYCRQAGAQTES